MLRERWWLGDCSLVKNSWFQYFPWHSYFPSSSSTHRCLHLLLLMAFGNCPSLRKLDSKLKCVCNCVKQLEIWGTLQIQDSLLTFSQREWAVSPEVVIETDSSSQVLRKRQEAKMEPLVSTNQNRRPVFQFILNLITISKFPRNMTFKLANLEFPGEHKEAIYWWTPFVPLKRVTLPQTMHSLLITSFSHPLSALKELSILYSSLKLLSTC